MMLLAGVFFVSLKGISFGPVGLDRKLSVYPVLSE